ncbi:MAG: ROK family protein [Legionellales bacterium]|nr:ROK family protein [Legionellales bacterium]
MMIANKKGKPITPYLCELTPKPAVIGAVLNQIQMMIDSFTVKFDRVSAGFPGVVHHGIIITAPHMDSSCLTINLQDELMHLTNKPAHVINDADMQGYGMVNGDGVELVITLGTGLGSALFLQGKLLPNLELAHHPFRDNKTYEQILGMAALKQHGIQKWHDFLKQAITLWSQTFNYNQLYLGGGYAEKIDFILPEKVKISDNSTGILGGVKLWGKVSVF